MLFYTVVICVLCMKEITIKAKTIYVSLLIIFYFYSYHRYLYLSLGSDKLSVGQWIVITMDERYLVKLM